MAFYVILHLRYEKNGNSINLLMISKVSSLFLWSFHFSSTMHDPINYCFARYCGAWNKVFGWQVVLSG
jgi:hypothetical protein